MPKSPFVNYLLIACGVRERSFRTKFREISKFRSKFREISRIFVVKTLLDPKGLAQMLQEQRDRCWFWDKKGKCVCSDKRVPGKDLNCRCLCLNVAGIENHLTAAEYDEKSAK